ncbi:MAG: hypothetical protein HYT06_01525 [Candidatus Levybacteria bacterium]|nr:hypothetical protein [Candidatus Levybacteria bacterium]
MNIPKLTIVGSMSHSFATYDEGVKERYGGGVSYGGKTAAILKIPTQIITIGADDIEPGINELQKLGLQIQRVKREKSNNFSNDYRNGERKIFARSYINSPLSLNDFNEKIVCDGAIFFPGLHEISLEMSLFRNKIDVLKVSHEDMEGIEGNSEVEKAQNLAENGFSIVLFTRGEKSTILARKGKPILEIPVEKTDGDIAGAGEVFSVGFMFEYLLTNDVIKAVFFGNICAWYKIRGEEYDYKKAKKKAEEVFLKAKQQ